MKLLIKQAANGFFWVTADGAPLTHPSPEIATQLYELSGPHNTQGEADDARREIRKVLNL